MLTMHVSGARSGLAPPTWGQRAIMRIMPGVDDGVETFNLGLWTELPDGVQVREAAQWIAQVVGAYDTLRTRLVVSGEDYAQVCDGAGQLMIEVVPAVSVGLAELAVQVRIRLQQTRFDVAAKWPVRFTILADGNRALAIVWAASHIAVDVRSMWALTAALGDPGRASQSGRQPMEQAAAETSDAGRRTDRLAMEYWRKQIQAGAPSVYPDVVLPPHQGHRFWYASLVSPALNAAASALAQRHRTTTSVVLLAAVNAELASLGGNDMSTLNLVSANRSHRDTWAALGTFSQLVPATTTVAGLALPEIIRQAGAASLNALRHGAFDLRSLDRLEAELAAAHGVLPDFALTFNDARRTSAADPDSAEVRACARGSVVWKGWDKDATRQDASRHVLRRGDPAVYLWILGDHQRLEIRLMLDTFRLRIDDGETLLYGVEERVLAEAMVADR